MDKTTTPCRAPTAAIDFEEILDPAIFRALGDTTRLAVLGRLATTRGALTVTEVAGCCGVHLSGVSRHLKTLHDAGLVTAERQGREVRYRLRCEVLSGALRAVADALDRCAAACCVPAGAQEGKNDKKAQKELQDDDGSENE